MKTKLKLGRADKIRLFAGLGLIIFAFLWRQLSIRMGGDAGWMRSAGLWLSGAMCRFWSLITLPCAELVWIFGVIAAVALLIILPVKKGLNGIISWATIMLLAAGVIYALFSFVYLVQYSAPPLGETLGLDAEPYSVDELYSTALRVASLLNEAAEKVPRDSSGLYSPSYYRDLTDKVGQSYQNGSMAALYSRGPGVSPKRGVLLSKAMSYLGLAGYYFPPTGESVVSWDLAETSIPFTTAHEISHSFGIGPEKEANFAAFLCCVEADDAELNYSGLFNGYIYLNNALYSADRELWRELYAALSPAVVADLNAKSAHLSQYEGKINEVGTAVNDAFIKSTGQPSGVKSYGLVCDLIVAYYNSIA